MHTLATQTGKLPGGAQQLAAGTQQAADGADQLAAGGAKLSAGLQQYQTGLRQQAAKITLSAGARKQVSVCLQASEAQQQVAPCALILAGYQAGAQRSLDGAAAGLDLKNQSLLDGASQLAVGQRQQATGLGKLAKGTEGPRWPTDCRRCRRGSRSWTPVRSHWPPAPKVSATGSRPTPAGSTPPRWERRSSVPA